ncbi:LysR family transcriptional regulator [Pseudorhodobacter aquimaris]|uniref:LysR family transcriptional regulator n=1 Tax=Pseudorhodobacter aquimaris TaxID=687412 RepID=UPI00067D0711|nr:LysR family transcriptional regulator [Pseudorhodobacter aquimaris]
MLNATWLETFTALCEVGHFTRTAALLGMTQPGVSQHLRKLEAQVGKALIVMDGKSFTLTPAGEAVLALGAARRRQEQDLFETIQTDDPNIGDIGIGCSGSFAVWLYPYLLERMQRAPELVIRLTAAPQTSVVSAVLAGDLDLGVTSEQVENPRLDAVKIGREELCLVVPRSCRAGGLDFQDLDALGFVAHPDGYAYADDLFSLNFPKDYKGSDRLKVRTFVNQIGQIPIPVALGLGYTILPKSGIDAFVAKQDLAIIQLPKPRFLDLWLISRRGRASFARIAALSALIDGAAKALGQFACQDVHPR